MHTDLPPPVARGNVYLRKEVLNAGRLQELGYSSLSDLANRAGLAHTTLLRCRDGSACGSVVIATLLRVTRLEFADLFEVRGT